ncbi:S-adenosyl-L-methionine-dependent methyltransferase [Conidiobolus coronatus NRRL 28638]|uniref:S-adenosyl-L-methionine-dependent methyltransferase n=1 Tax=Conidiobolus coronatus (strain ATCC 28846 / CBS 209.66 / NRRL 28638) TaxID=796925 RepID=A0A137NZD2_CONC2|nr:S-adenosyl-L-methionine-dependent methyltransferase [Conidiobolus coronatus NRRL 28638]|eukprot:KXN67939.1 S-adenosyl-L-methionine-dependent methyltransferase [Conidiobolus coronatus NRRL 28638]
MEVDNVNLGTKPMNDYNKSSSMQQRVIENGYDNLVVLNENIKLNGNKLTIGDLGCSHGKNSMTAINQLLGLIEKNESINSKIEKLLVYHEDLEFNDFNQVQNCLDDKSISYLNNSYITKNKISTEIQFLPKSFYEPLFEPGSIDIIMCYTAIHFLPQYKSLTTGLWYEESVETPENIEYFTKLSKKYLIEWLNLRYNELNQNGMITINIFEGSSIFRKINSAWDEYLATKGFKHSDLDKVNVAGMLRSSEVLNNCLDQFKGKFKVLRSYLSKEIYKFGRDHLSAVFLPQAHHGLSYYPEIFPTQESRSEFFEGYLDYYYEIKNYSIEEEFRFNFLVLQKI